MKVVKSATRNFYYEMTISQKNHFMSIDIHDNNHRVYDTENANSRPGRCGRGILSTKAPLDIVPLSSMVLFPCVSITRLRPLLLRGYACTCLPVSKGGGVKLGGGLIII